MPLHEEAPCPRASDVLEILLSEGHEQQVAGDGSVVAVHASPEGALPRLQHSVRLGGLGFQSGDQFRV